MTRVMACCPIIVSAQRGDPDFSPAAERILGYRAEDMVVTMTPAIIHNPDEVVERAKIFSTELGMLKVPFKCQIETLTI